MKVGVSYLSRKLGKMEGSIDAQQQYSRRNCLLLHGITETKGGDTDNIVLEVLNNDMDLNMYIRLFLTVPIESVIRKVKKGKRKINVKFVRYYDRRGALWIKSA